MRKSYRSVSFGEGLPYDSDKTLQQPEARHSCLQPSRNGTAMDFGILVAHLMLGGGGPPNLN